MARSFLRNHNFMICILFFQVTIICQKECRATSWNRKTLLDILQRNPYLKTVINSVVSIDIAQKVFAMNKIMLEGFGEMRHSIYTSNGT